MEKMPIYLDNNATTPMDPKVFAAMQPYFMDRFGNAASATHAYGWEAAKAVDQAREDIAKMIGASEPESLIFTSGTTESNNLVIKGLFFANTGKDFHIITQKTEHKCVLKSCQFVERLGAKVTYLGVDSNGLVNPEHVANAITDQTALVSIMYANNEIGTIQNIKEIAANVHKKPGVLFHTDAAQAIGKLPIDVQKDGIDLMSFLAHKIHGPKGIGALYISPKLPKSHLEPLLHGGGHEFGLRSGTLNVPAIVGFAKALELCLNILDSEAKRQIELRDYFISQIQKQVDHVQLNGHPVQRLPNNANLSFQFVDSGQLILAMPELAISTGSACESGTTEPSYVIQALGKGIDAAKTSIRIGLSRYTTKNELDQAIKIIVAAVKKLRSESLEYEMFLNKSK